MKDKTTKSKNIEGLGELDQQPINFPDADKGYNCPCCGHFCKRYRRQFNANMAVVMITLFRKKRFGFVPIEEFMRLNGHQRSGDFPYLTHWGLMEKMSGKRADGSKNNGFYKLTDKGRQFVKKEITVPKTLLIYNGKVEGFEGQEISIIDVLGKKFDYRELMGLDTKVYTT